MTLCRISGWLLSEFKKKKKKKYGILHCFSTVGTLFREKRNLCGFCGMI